MPFSFEICSLFEERYRVINRDVSKGQKSNPNDVIQTDTRLTLSKQPLHLQAPLIDKLMKQSHVSKKLKTTAQPYLAMPAYSLFTSLGYFWLLRRELLGLQLQTQTQGSTTIIFTTFLSFNVSKHFNFSFSSLINLM